jgi:hypothetical protein
MAFIPGSGYSAITPAPLIRAQGYVALFPYSFSLDGKVKAGLHKLAFFFAFATMGI